MPNVDYQRHTFLSGEVSPSLYERADMEKFGRWFSEAENIRFRETGAFRNRCGFIKVADTKHNLAGEVIKLLSFSFNDEESFLVELGPGYARFFRNGKPIMAGASPYEIETPFLEFTEVDIKYAQAGDTIFLTHPTYGIYELARLQADGSNWEFRKFNTDILPMKEENDDKSKTVSLTGFTQDVKTISLLNPDTSTYLNVSFTFNSQVVYTAASATLNEIVDGITDAIGADYVTSLSGTTLSITPAEALGTIPDFSISFGTSFVSSQQHVASTSATLAAANTNNSLTSSAMSFSGWANLDSLYVRVTKTAYENRKMVTYNVFEGTKSLVAASIPDSRELAAGYGNFSVAVPVPYSSRFGQNAAINVIYSSLGASVDSSTNSISFTIAKDRNVGTNANYGVTIYSTLYGHTDTTVNHSFTYNSVTASSSTDYYLLTGSDSSILKDVQKGECVLVKHSVDENTLNGNYSTGTHTLGPVRSDGNWRAYNLGNWAGKVQIQYSTDNKVTWVDYYSWTSEATDQPYNNSTSGSLITDNVVYFRVILTVTAGTIRFYFTSNSFDVNSYYKCLFKASDTQLVVDCIKNDVGLFSNATTWRLQAFSHKEGFPQTIAFYQNRLFFGKDYIIYGSRNNDFWDFYEPVKLQADDPVNMSLLSTKVNTIRNLLTQRSFFTFTAGGEFGIGSEGSLTQNDKYLKPFSANGSAPCLPITISDVVLFVDKSFNSIRALKYTLEADGYEAPDITLTLRALLENERIVSTDIIYEEKEALFLSDTGTIWVLKYITDQNIMSWSHWKHGFGKITNICVVPNGSKHELYIGVEYNGKKWLEKLEPTEFMDTVEYFEATQAEKVTVTGFPGDPKVIIQGNKRTFAFIDANNQIEAPEDTTIGFKVGSVYTSTATLLAPTVQSSDYSHSTFSVKNPYKVFFYYLDSYGFKVGVEEDDKMEVEWQPVNSDIDDELNLTSGKKSVLIPSRFENSARVSFVQEEPYPMEVCDVLIETDFGGK